MESHRTHESVAEPHPWATWTERGVWGKSAVGAGLVAVIGASVAAASEVSSARDAYITFALYHGVEAIGRLTPFVALVSILTEPVRCRSWAFASILIWATASIITAAGQAFDIARF